MCIKLCFDKKCYIFILFYVCNVLQLPLQYLFPTLRIFLDIGHCLSSFMSRSLWKTTDNAQSSWGLSMTDKKTSRTKLTFSIIYTCYVCWYLKHSYQATAACKLHRNSLQNMIYLYFTLEYFQQLLLLSHEKIPY